MTWKRVATALVLIPVVVGLVLYGSTAAVAVATAVITVLALREYFALGEAIGHRGYKVWTIFCSLLLVFMPVRLIHGFVFDLLSGRLPSKGLYAAFDPVALLFFIFVSGL